MSINESSTGCNRMATMQFISATRDCKGSLIRTSLDKANLERRIILTFDLDFGDIAAFSRGRIVSVVLFRLHNTRTPHVIERLQSALNFADALEKAQSSLLKNRAAAYVIYQSVSSDYVQQLR